jgi:hypothetical protein
MECTPSSLVYFRYDNSYMNSNWNFKCILIRTPLLLIVVHFVMMSSQTKHAPLRKRHSAQMYVLKLYVGRRSVPVLKCIFSLQLMFSNVSRSRLGTDVFGFGLDHQSSILNSRGSFVCIASKLALDLTLASVLGYWALLSVVKVHAVSSWPLNFI